MKISIGADFHLNKAVFKGVYDKTYTSLPFRTADHMRAFEHFVDKNINEIKPDIIIIAGDVYDNHNPSNELRKFFNSKINMMLEAGIEIFILVGNHDICKKHHALSPITGFKINNLHIVEEPTVFVREDKLLMMMPYSIEVESGNIELKKQYYDFADDVKEQISFNKDWKSKELLFFGHFGVKGAILKEYNSKGERNQFVNGKEGDIHLGDLDALNADYIFLGDYHQHQILGLKSSFAMYTGSLEKTDITEADDEKGFVIFDDSFDKDDKMGKTKFIKNSTCRPMLDIVGDKNEILKKVNSISTDNDGAIVRVKFTGKQKDLKDFSSSYDDIKKMLDVKIHPIYIYQEQEVDIEESEQSDKDKKMTKSEEDILSKGYIDGDMVMKVVEEMIKEKEPDESEQKEIIALAKGLSKK